MMGEHGRGTLVPVETRRKDGTIRRRVRVALTMPDGKRVWRTLRDEKAARKALDELVAMREADIDPTTQTLAVYLRSWIQRRRDAKRQKLRPRTLAGYEAIIEQRIIPSLGGVPLGRLSRRRVQAWVEAMDGSAGTVRNAHAVLRKALGNAVGDSLERNPAIGVELPDRPEFAGSPLTAEEAHRLLEATEGDRLHPLWRLAIVTGLRSGELRGLSRDALETSDERTGPGVAPALDGRDAGRDPRDPSRGARVLGLARREVHGDGTPEPRAESLSGGMLTVTAQLQRINGRWVLGPTKAARSLQRIALDPTTVSILRKHLARMAEERTPSWEFFGLMFVTPEGQPYHDAQVLREFHAACDKAGIRRRRLHDLRGSSATLMRGLGVAEETRMARLGHSTVAMSRHYAQASEEQDRLAALAIEEAIG